MHSREIFHPKNKTKPQQKKGNLFIVPSQEEAFATVLSVVGNEKQQPKVGTAIEHTSVITEESGGQGSSI